MRDEIPIGPDPLSPDDVVAVARGTAPAFLTDAGRKAVVEGRERVESLAAGVLPAYGVSTGFGALATRHIPPERRVALQRSLIRSHAAGTGPEVEREVVRALMLLRLRTLASGRTGVRLETAEALLALLNTGITPVVREYGSLGCSGDLAPLAHVALALMGEGQVRDANASEGVESSTPGAEGYGASAAERARSVSAQGGSDANASEGVESSTPGAEGYGASAAERARSVSAQAGSPPNSEHPVPAFTALRAAGLRPVELAAKEGLALINGTDGMLAHLVLACYDLRRLLRVADVAAAMSVEALLGTDRVFASDLAALRPHPGQGAAMANMRALLAGSQIVASHRGPECTRVQDAYSLRCAPQVAGAARDTHAHAEAVAKRELASIIDNPVVLPDGRVESNGNFHGAPVGYALDFLAIAVADVASIAERRTDRMLDTARSHGLPAFLAEDPGVDSGHMIAQYTQAAIVSELKRLAVPASVDSIPSSAMQEDHVSMGWSAGRKLRRGIDGLARVLAVEILTAARALDFRAPLQPAPATAAARDAVREQVPGPGADRYLAAEIDAAAEFVTDGSLLRAVEAVTVLE